MISKIKHIAIIVDDIEQSLTFWHNTLGLEMKHVEEVPDQQVRVAFMSAGDGHIELISPTTKDSGAARFLAKEGGGLHHIALEVNSLDEAVEILRAKGLRLTENLPSTGAMGRKVVFVHPESSGGVLVELYESE